MKKRRPSDSLISYNEALTRLRTQIDQVDHDLIRILGRRMKIVDQIGRLKTRHRQPVHQNRRFQELVKDRVKTGRNLGLDRRFTSKLLKLIHTEAIRLQKKRSRRSTQATRGRAARR